MNIGTLKALEWAISMAKIKDSKKANYQASSHLYSLILLYESVGGKNSFMTTADFEKLRQKVIKLRDSYCETSDYVV